MLLKILDEYRKKKSAINAATDHSSYFKEELCWLQANYMAAASRIWPMAAGEPGGPPQKLLRGKGQGRLDTIIAQLFSISNDSVILRD